MTFFELAVNRTIDLETGGDLSGALHTNPDDIGGTTKFGIAQRFHPEVDVASLTRTQAEAIYKAEYWNPFKLDRIRDPLLAATVFDLYVNPGPSQAGKIVQRALNFLRGKRTVKLLVDGKIGRKTIARLHIEAERKNRYQLLAAIAAFRIAYYASRKESQTQAFGRGWLNRALLDLAAVNHEGALLHTFKRV